jgi:hypothetical protein
LSGSVAITSQAPDHNTLQLKLSYSNDFEDANNHGDTTGLPSINWTKKDGLSITENIDFYEGIK